MLAFDVSQQVLFSGAVTGLTYARDGRRRDPRSSVRRASSTSRSARWAASPPRCCTGSSSTGTCRSGCRSSPASRSARCSARRSSCSSCAACSPRRASSCSSRSIGAAQLLLFFQLILPDVTAGPAVPDAVLEDVGHRRRPRPQRGAHRARRHAGPRRSRCRCSSPGRSTGSRSGRRRPTRTRPAWPPSNIKHMSTLVWVIAGHARRDRRHPVRAAEPGRRVGARRRPRACCCASSPSRLIAGMASLPIALASGVAIGMTESLVIYNYNDQRGLLDALLFVVVHRHAAARGRAAAGSPKPTAGAGRSRRASARSRRRSNGCGGCARLPLRGGLVVVLVALFPLVFLDLPSQREAWSRVLLYAMVALSLTVLTGWAGQLSLGQFAFVGVGGMTAAALVREGVGFVPALVHRRRSSPALRRDRRRAPGVAPARAVPRGLDVRVRGDDVVVAAVSRRVPRRRRPRANCRARSSRCRPRCSTKASTCARRARTTRSAWSRWRSCLSACALAATHPLGPLDDRGARQRARRRRARHLADRGEAHGVRHRRLDRRASPAGCSSASSPKRSRPTSSRPSRCA